MARMTIRWLLRGGIAQLGLTPHEASVLMYLIDRGDRDGRSFPSQVRMAKELGQGRRGVQNALTHLEDIGAIRVAAHVKGRSNGYQVEQQPAHPVRTPPAHFTGQVVDNGPAHGVRTKYLDVTQPGLPDHAPAEPAESATSPREIPSSQRRAFESVQPQPPRRRPAA